MVPRPEDSDPKPLKTDILFAVLIIGLLFGVLGGLIIWANWYILDVNLFSPATWTRGE